VVYIREAHASDEWPMGRHVIVPQPKSMEERIKCAQDFVRATCLKGIDVFIDDISDSFMLNFSAHPQRFFIIDSAGMLKFKATPMEGEYSLADVEEILLQLGSSS